MEMNMKRFLNPNTNRVTVIVEEPVLEMSNPNADIFDVGSEEGGDDEDNMLSMIGDATQKHVDELSVKDRLSWEHFIHFANGNISRREPDTRFRDKDELNLHSEDLENFFQNYPNIPQAMHSYYQEAIEEELERRDAVMIGSIEDVYNNNEGLVSFQDWEDNPQMMNHVDIPSTPRDLFFHAGETKQPFYDEFPEGHPDTQVLNQFIRLVNRDIDEFNDKYVEFLHKFADTNPMRDHTRKVIHKVCEHLITTKNHNELIIQMLQAIDRAWAKTYREKAIGKALQDPVVKLMVIKNDEFVELQDKGINPVQQVKDFGSELFKSQRRRMTSHHWHLYKRLKNKFQMRVFIRGVEINSSRMEELRKIFDGKTARNVWFARPFQTAVELHTKGFVSRDLLTNDPVGDKVLDIIVRISEKKDLETFNRLAAGLVAKQQDNRLGLDEESWKNIWAFYRTTKKSLIKEVSNGKGQGQQQRV